jgi:hypothetical protein
MKIILSRKGFDSQYGGCASPILPDGRLVSLPIPVRSRSTCRFVDLQVPGLDVGTLAESLSRGQVRAADACHLDPDLVNSLLPRTPGWRPAFGQTGIAQRHLAKRGVGKGDLFLFFGWFREVVQDGNGRWVYRRTAPDMHHLYGWLQVDDIVHLGARPREIIERYPGLAQHPHFLGDWDPENTLYLATNRLMLPGLRTDAVGAGLFRKTRQCLTLTAPNATRSEWLLPGFFEPNGGRAPLSFHSKPERWRRTAGGVLLQSVAKGQEFVLDADDMELVIRWLSALFEEE